MPREFLLPDLGEGIAEAQIIRVLVKAGDQIKEDQYLMEVETDKAAVEIPSPYSGIAKNVHVKEGETVNVGDVIVTFDDGDSAAPQRKKKEESAAALPAAESKEPAEAPAEKRPAPARQKTTAAAAPAVRKLAREMGIDLDSLSGTGPGGRITRDDLEKHAKGDGPTPTAEPVTTPRPPRPKAGPVPGIADADKWGSIHRAPISQIRKTIANQMARSAYTAVHVTHADEIDITDLDRLRRDLNTATDNDPKMTMMTFLIRATCISLRKHPIFNASFDEEGGEIIYKDYINIGIAVDTERGLVVPVVRNADQLGLREIAMQLRSIADRVRSNKFSVEDLRGGTFTITNVGALGGTFSTPIINYPEVAILALGRSRKVPVVRQDQIVPALVLPVAVSFDHRAMDGANAARFTREIAGYLETPAKFLLD